MAEPSTDDQLAEAYWDEQAQAWRCERCDAVLQGDGNCPRCDVPGPE